MSILFFFAKYEGAVLAGWDCNTGLYSEARTSGLRTEKIEPRMRVAGYMERRIASKVVGMKGDFLGVILGAVEGVSGIRVERRFVFEGESISIAITWILEGLVYYMK